MTDQILTVSQPTIVATTVVNIRAGKGYDIYIGRPSKWSNPFSHKPSAYPDVKRVSTRREAVAEYEKYLLTERHDLLCSLNEIKGKVLGCFCWPGEECHGLVLARLADKYAGKRLKRVTRDQLDRGYLVLNRRHLLIGSPDESVPMERRNFTVFFRMDGGDYMVIDPSEET